jgi:hypothetical protein
VIGSWVYKITQHRIRKLFVGLIQGSGPFRYSATSGYTADSLLFACGTEIVTVIGRALKTKRLKYASFLTKRIFKFSVEDEFSALRKIAPSPTTYLLAQTFTVSI